MDDRRETGIKDNAARLVLASLLRSTEEVAIGDLENQLSRATLIENVRVQSEQLLLQGVIPGNFIIVLCDRGLRFWVELLAAWAIGAKPVCVESTISAAHARSVLAMTEAKSILADGVCVEEDFARLQAIQSTFDPHLQPESARDSFLSIAFASDDTMPDMAGLIFTSGTTGLPKGVPLTHRALCANAQGSAFRLRLRSTDRLMIATPFRFISSISHFLVTLMSDASFFGLEHPMMIKDLLTALNELEITAFGGSPFHIQFIAMAGQARLPRLRWAMSSGDHLRPAVIDQINTSFDNLELHVVYGMAELGGRFCTLPPDSLREKKGSVGYPIAGFELTVRNEDGSICRSGEIGNIHVSGLLEFGGYFANPAADKMVLGPNGFLNGDKGYLDEDGYLFLAGRSDSVFKRSGLKVSAQVISVALLELPEIRDIFVSSEDDAIEGQVPVAYIAWADQPVATKEMISAARALLAVNHIPKRFVTLPDIPRTGSGKVDRKRLAALASNSA